MNVLEQFEQKKDKETDDLTSLTKDQKRLARDLYIQGLIGEKQLEYVLTLGKKDANVVFRHVLDNARPNTGRKAKADEIVARIAA